MIEWKIPLFIPDLTIEDVEAACAPIREGWLTMGDRTRRFEKAFTERVEDFHTFAVTNGTAALQLALAGLGIAAGDEVLVPSLTFVACANAIVSLGAKPVFVDLCGESDWTLSPDDMLDKIGDKTRAVMVVHYAGFPCRMEAIVPIARQAGIAVIEDSAHALFSRREGTTCGCFGDVGCFSFFTNKNMTTGEGGMVVTKDDKLAERIRLLRSHGMTTLTLERHRGYALSYDVTAFGYNYRIDDIRSAIGIVQLRRLDDSLHRRKRIYSLYIDALKDIEEIDIPFLQRKNDTVGHHIFPIRLRDGSDRQAFMNAMREDGIQTSIHYPPIHTFSVYRSLGEKAECPLTESVAAGEVTLPFYPSMSDDDVHTVCEAVKRHVI